MITNQPGCPGQPLTCTSCQTGLTYLILLAHPQVAIPDGHSGVPHSIMSKGQLIGHDGTDINTAILYGYLHPPPTKMGLTCHKILLSCKQTNATGWLFTDVDAVVLAIYIHQLPKQASWVCHNVRSPMPLAWLCIKVNAAIHNSNLHSPATKIGTDKAYRFYLKQKWRPQNLYSRPSNVPFPYYNFQVPPYSDPWWWILTCLGRN